MKVFILALLFIALLNETLSFECGLEGSASRVYKGTTVAKKKYPWMALVRIDLPYDIAKYPNLRRQCAGTLIDKQHVITGLLCLFDPPNDKVDKKQNVTIEVDFGISNTFYDDATTIKAELVDIDTGEDGKTWDGDFAILKLEKPVEFSKKIAPICLPNSDDDLEELTLVGWGWNMVHRKDRVELKEGQVEYISRKSCEQMSPELKVKVTERQMCAKNKRYGFLNCDMENGPLMHKNADGRWVLVGISSKVYDPDSCEFSAKSSPGVYQRVVPFTADIKRVAPESVFVDI